MVQEIAKKLIRMGKKEEAQDLYFIPRKEEYQVFMRVGDERRFVQSFPFEEMTAIISHFKFVAGMNVGEKRRSQLGSCDYPLEDGVVSIRLSTVGDYRGYESLVIRLLHDEERNYGFGLISYLSCRRNWLVVVSISLQVPLARERPLSCMLWRKSALQISKSCPLKILSRSSKRICFSFS